MAVLRAARLPELALQYSTLSERLVSYETTCFGESATSQPDYTTQDQLQSMACDPLSFGHYINTMPMSWMQDSWTLIGESIS
jgi:hypothetical protein